MKEPAVQALIAAINDGDRRAFFAALTPDATMSDDGTDRNPAEWSEREIFSSHGHLDVISAGDGGRSLIAAYRNDTWGEMRTRWAFTITDGKVSRFETGQAGLWPANGWAAPGRCLALCDEIITEELPPT